MIQKNNVTSVGYPENGIFVKCMSHRLHFTLTRHRLTDTRRVFHRENLLLRPTKGKSIGMFLFNESDVVKVKPNVKSSYQRKAVNNNCSRVYT